MQKTPEQVKSFENPVAFTPLDLDEFASVFGDRYCKMTALTIETRLYVDLVAKVRL